LKIVSFHVEFNSEFSTTTFRVSRNIQANPTTKNSNLVLTFLTYYFNSRIKIDNLADVSSVLVNSNSELEAFRAERKVERVIVELERKINFEAHRIDQKFESQVNRIDERFDDISAQLMKLNKYIEKNIDKQNDLLKKIIDHFEQM